MKKQTISKMIATIAVCSIGLLSASAMAGDTGKKVEAFKLKDGSAVTVFENGVMKMTDSQGKFFTMKDGEQMETADGQVIMMKEGILWKQIRIRGTLHPNRP